MPYSTFGSLRDNMGVYAKGLAVLLIDASGCKPADDFVRSQGAVLEFANELKAPIYVIYMDGGSDIDPSKKGLILAKKFVTNVDKTLLTIAERAKDPKATYIRKRNNNAFSETNLDLLLQTHNRKIHTVLVMGEMANSCVKMTALGDKNMLGPNRTDFIHGAIGLGLRVITSPTVCRRAKVNGNYNPADLAWMYHDRVFAFEDL